MTVNRYEVYYTGNYVWLVSDDNLFKVRERVCLASDVEALEEEVNALKSELATAIKGLKAVRSLMDESYGVYGLHQNGASAPWESIEMGGHFETWLIDFNMAENIKQGEGK